MNDTVMLAVPALFPFTVSVAVPASQLAEPHPAVQTDVLLLATFSVRIPSPANLTFTVPLVPAVRVSDDGENASNDRLFALAFTVTAKLFE